MQLFFYTDGKGNYYKSYVEVFRVPYVRVTDPLTIAWLNGAQSGLTLIQPDAFRSLQSDEPNANQQVRVTTQTPTEFYQTYTATSQPTTVNSAFELLSLQGVNIPADLQINPALTNKPAGPSIPQLISQSNTNLFNTVTAPQQATANAANTTTTAATVEKAGFSSGWLLLIALFGGAYLLRKK